MGAGSGEDGYYRGKRPLLGGRQERWKEGRETNGVGWTNIEIPAMEGHGCLTVEASGELPSQRTV